MRPSRRMDCVFCLIDGVEKHNATVLASIAMLSEDVAPKTKSPAA